MIDHVRSTVLSILNKENRGTLTVSQFNAYAKHAQQTLFDQYFSEYSRLVSMKNARRLSRDQGDKLSMLRSNIDKFMKTATITPCVDYLFTCPLTAGSNCVWNVVDCDGASTQISITPNPAEDVVETHSVKPNPTLTSVDGIAAPSVSYYSKPTDLYSEVSLVYNGKLMEYIPKHKDTYISASNIAGPTELYPGYTDENELWYIRPSTLVDDLKLNYIRTLADPKWTYTVIGENPVFNPSAADYQDFELSPDDETSLVVEILKLSGVTIREPEVAQAAAQLDAIETQKENV